MAQRRNPDDSTEDMSLDDPSYNYDPSNASPNTGVTGGGGAQSPAVTGQPSPAPAGGAPNPFDRNAFRDAWMGSSGGLQEFLAAHPEFSGVKTGGSKGDLAYLPSGEIMDLQIAKGANGDNAQHGWTGVGQTGPGGAQMYSQAGGGSAGNSAGAGGGYGSGFNGDIKDTLKGIFANEGNFNQDIVNRRTENASENLHRFAKSQGANDQAALAARGLAGSGADITAQNRLSSNIADQYSNAASGIFADESHAADSRMMQALQTAAGMSESEAQQAVDWFNAQTGRNNVENNFTLGQGQLALGDQNSKNSYDLGRRGIDYNYDALNSHNDDASIQQLIDILNARNGGTNTAANGYVGN